MSWDTAIANVSAALARVLGTQGAEQAQGTTLEQAILEEVVVLDSSQTDAVSSLGSGNLIDLDDNGNVRMGELQRLQQMRDFFFGDDSGTSPGFFAQMGEMGDPNMDSDL